MRVSYLLLNSSGGAWSNTVALSGGPTEPQRTYGRILWPRREELVGVGGGIAWPVPYLHTDKLHFFP